MTIGSFSAYAAHAGVSAPYVTKLRQAGRLVLVVDERGRERVDFEASDQRVADTADMGRARNGENARGLRKANAAESPSAPENAAVQPSGDGGDLPEAAPARGASLPKPEDPIALAFRQARAKDAIHSAQISEMNLRERQGKLLDRSVVERVVFDQFRALRDQVFRAPMRAAARCLNKADAREIEHVIEEELRKGFTEWEEKTRTRLGPVAQG